MEQDGDVSGERSVKVTNLARTMSAKELYEFFILCTEVERLSLYRYYY